MRTRRNWDIREKMNGLIEVVYNPNGIVGAGEQATQEPNVIYSGRDYSEALAAIKNSSEGI